MKYDTLKAAFGPTAEARASTGEPAISSAFRFCPLIILFAWLLSSINNVRFLDIVVLSRLVLHVESLGSATTKVFCLIFEEAVGESDGIASSVGVDFLVTESSNLSRVTIIWKLMVESNFSSSSIFLSFSVDFARAVVCVV